MKQAVVDADGEPAHRGRSRMVPSSQNAVGRDDEQRADATPTRAVTIGGRCDERDEGQDEHEGGDRDGR